VLLHEVPVEQPLDQESLAAHVAPVLDAHVRPVMVVAGLGLELLGAQVALDGHLGRVLPPVRLQLDLGLEGALAYLAGQLAQRRVQYLVVRREGRVVRKRLVALGALDQDGRVHVRRSILWPAGAVRRVLPVVLGEDVDQRPTDVRAPVALHVLDAVLVDHDEALVVIAAAASRCARRRLQPDLDRLEVGAVVAELRVGDVSDATYHAGGAAAPGRVGQAWLALGLPIWQLWAG